MGFVGAVLAVFVVIIHNSSFANYEVSYWLSVYLFLKQSICELAVPGFFVIAGFNYFRDYKQGVWNQKLRRRVRTLLVPYVVWNALYTAFALLTSYSFLSRYFIGRERFQFSLQRVVLGCLYHGVCNLHFWFVLALIVLAVLAPFLYAVLRDKRVGV